MMFLSGFFWRQKLDIRECCVPPMLSYKIALFPAEANEWVFKKGQAEVTIKPPHKPVCRIRLKFTSDCLLSQNGFYQRLASVGKLLYALVLERG